MRTRSMLGVVVVVAGLTAAACTDPPVTGGQATATSVTSATAPSSAPSTSSTSGTPGATSPSAALTSAVVAALTAEHQAEATYRNVVTRLGDVGPFSTVASSEADHVATLEALARKHGVALPPGPFTGQAAPATKAAACQLGVTIEQGLITLYDQALPGVTSYGDAVQVFENLSSATSGNHLPAFQRCA